MDAGLELDLSITHSFLNTLNSSYQGGYVYFKVLEQLAPECGAGESAEKLKAPLDRIGAWLADFRQHRPLFRDSERPGMNEAAAQAWRFLQVARDRLERLAPSLTATANVERLMSDRHALSQRIAVLCESAYARQHFIQGLVEYGEVMGREEVSDRWRQQLLGCRQGVAEAHHWLERVQQTPQPAPAAVVEQMLDETLIFPTVMIQKITDMDSTTGNYRNCCDFTDLGIPAELALKWGELGFAPYHAALWYRVGVDAESAAAWRQYGFEAMAAMHFLLRGFGLAEALPWWSRRIGGPAAAAWLRAGCSPEEAQAWISQGINRPEQLAAPPAPN